MNIEDFYGDLRNLVSMRAATDGAYTSEAYMSEVAERLVDAEEVTQFQVLTFAGLGKKRRKLAVNGYDLDDGDESVALAVVHYRGSDRLRTITYTEALDSLKALRSFLDEAMSGDFTEDREPSAPEYQLATSLKGKGKAVSRFRLYLVSDSELSGSARAVESSELNGVPVEYHIWDVKRLQQVHESAQGREELEIDLTEWVAGGVPALEITDSAGDLRTFLAALPGRMVAELYAKYGSRLLEGNVRSFLSLRGRTNQGIRKTILNEPANFLAYNNGISATATSAEVVNGRIVRLRDLQIVNGGQTTASLFYVHKDVQSADLSNVHVQMKLVVVEPEVAGEMIPLISRFTNSQNTVSEADFFSNHPFHVRMEELSKKVLAPARSGVNFQTKWYYERTRGQHQNEHNKRTGSERKKFDAEYPKSQLITKTDAAKFEVSWGMAPHQVSAGAQKNFRAYAEMIAKDFNKSDAKFNEPYFKDLVAKAILFQNVRAAISKSSWYESGQYLANLTTYAIAKLAFELGHQDQARGFSLGSIWERQEVSHVVLDETVGIARKVLKVLTDDSRPFQNVTEWAKRQQCWDEVKAVRHQFSEEFTEECNLSYIATIKNEGPTVATRFDPAVSSGIHVRNIDRMTWAAIDRFVREKKLANRDDLRVLDKMSNGSNYFPFAAEATQLLRIYVAAEGAGFMAYG